MKKNLIFSMIACLLLTGLLSFTLIRKSHAKSASPLPKKTVAVKAKAFTCAGTVGTLSGSGSSFTWGGSADHYNYGGYFKPVELFQEQQPDIVQLSPEGVMVDLG
jgi:hypothetical protein